MVRINEVAPQFTAKAFHNDSFTSIDLRDYRGKWVVLLFYPADFTFVCPTEIGDAADHYGEFTRLNAEVMSVSTDTEFVHKAWYDNSETIGKVKFPMLADPTGKICRAYGTYIDEDGLSLRATFIVDPDGVLKAMDVHDNSIGRSTAEILRKLKASQYVREHGGEVCPANWEPGEKTLKPGIDQVGKI